MKKQILLALGLAVSLSAAAQSWEDALYFSENNYLGTARSLGMGNALTAVGGDPGSIGFNPAGSAVAGYTQFVISPGFTISTSRAAGLATPDEDQPIGLGDQVRSRYTRFKLPNAGVIFTIDSGRRSGLKRTSFGFVINSTNDFTGRVGASGINMDNSYAASLASSAEGYTPQALGQAGWFEAGPRWTDMVGYRSGMISSIPGNEKVYQAITEDRNDSGIIQITGPLSQQYGQRSYGSKYDILINFGANFDDKFYIGANVGITSLNYSLSEFWQEEPAEDGPIWDRTFTDGTGGRFRSLLMKRSYAMSGSGIYAKAGLLWRPVAGLRLGAAIQTPTLSNFTVRQAYSGEVNIQGMSLKPSTTPEDSWSFSLVQPYRVNLGVAYSFGSLAVVSADYEMAHFSTAHYSSAQGGEPLPDYLKYANEDIRDLLGVGHAVRIGAEFKPTPALSVRAGYNFNTRGQRNSLETRYDEDFRPVGWDIRPLSLQDRLSMARHGATLGVGYAFGMFCIDAAVRLRFLPQENILVYTYSKYDDSGDHDYTNKYVDWNVPTPEIGIHSLATDAILTFGWRF